MLKQGLSGFQKLLFSAFTGGGIGSMAFAGKALSVIGSQLGQKILPLSEINNYVGKADKSN